MLPKQSGQLYDFYPRSPCGERPAASSGATKSDPISIHALLAESDPIIQKITILTIAISIHALLAESDNRFGRPIDVQLIFLSTLSLRRATLAGPSGPAFLYNFYPRSPCGERPAIDVFLAVWAVISIHALLAESDSALHNIFKLLTDFYPRSPCGERRAGYTGQQSTVRISIHALLAESDR